MIKYKQEEYEILTKCPWCFSNQQLKWGNPVSGFDSVKCRICGLIYIKNRLNKAGLEKCYKYYLSDVHRSNDKLNKQREIMYKIEFALIRSYCKKGDVLDIGASGGYFLNYFKKEGYGCYGVEFGEEAALKAKRKFSLYYGVFPEIEIKKKFNLIIFRGVIEHISYPKLYLTKAVKLLKKGGFIYITSTPNSESICCKLFKEKWNQHSPPLHLMHFNSGHFNNFFRRNGFIKIKEWHFYEETPYAQVSKDIAKLNEALELKIRNKKIPFRSPPFWGNLMSLIYKKK